jgi:uncharacterized protein (TIGR03067 family)
MDANLLFAATLSLCLAPAPIKKAAPVRDDMKALVGTWEVVWASDDGEGRLVQVGHLFRIDDSRVHLIYSNGFGSYKWVIRIDSKTTPKRMYLLRTARSFDYHPCIYHLDGDRLMIHRRAGEPPPDFGLHPSVRILELRRKRE